MTDLTSDPTQWFPMPAALVTSRTADGRANLMGIGYVGFTCWQPPVIYLGVNTARYSGQVIRETSEFVVALPERNKVLNMDYCGFISGKDCDKFEATGFTTRDAADVRPPLINEAAVNLECKLLQVIELGSHNLLLGEVVQTHVAETYASGARALEPIVLVSRRYRAASEYVCDFGASITNPPVAAEVPGT
jgi:flavin reductase (DIM6/NTAB) family NADH-FMN oxidoreductase RutF